MENLAEELKNELDNNCTSDFISETPSPQADHKYHTESSGISVHSPDFPLHQYQQPYPESDEAPEATSQRFHTSEKILRALNKIVERYEREDSEEQVMHEWRQLAVIMDKILFWIFLLGTLSSTVIVLILAPIIKWLWQKFLLLLYLHRQGHLRGSFYHISDINIIKLNLYFI